MCVHFIYAELRCARACVYVCVRVCVCGAARERGNCSLGNGVHNMWCVFCASACVRECVQALACVRAGGGGGGRRGEARVVCIRVHPFTYYLCSKDACVCARGCMRVRVYVCECGWQ